MQQLPDTELDKIVKMVRQDYARRGEKRALFVAVMASLVPSVVGSLIGAVLFLVYFK